MKTRNLEQLFNHFLGKIQKLADDNAAPAAYLQKLAEVKKNIEQLDAAIKKLEEIKQDNGLKSVADHALLEYEKLIRYLLSAAFLYEEGNEYDYEARARYSRLHRNVDPYDPYSVTCYTRLNKNLQLLLPIVENVHRFLMNPSDPQTLGKLTIATYAANDYVMQGDAKKATAHQLGWAGGILFAIGLITLALMFTPLAPIAIPLGLGLMILGFGIGFVGVGMEATNRPKITSAQMFKPIINRANHAIGLLEPENIDSHSLALRKCKRQGPYMT